MIVCIAEKPSVAREIATVLGARSRHDGYLEGNGYCVTWTYGHLCELKTPDEYDPKWKRWSLEMLPIIPDKHQTKLIRRKGISKQFSVIKTLLNNCSYVINCGDAGLEGELIQRWVLQQAGFKKEVRRLWISSLTEEAIREGFTSLKSSDEYDSLYHAAFSRSVGDWLLGMNASRLYTLKFSGGAGVLSIGRVQTPTLALIVQRHQEIQDFVPEPYYLLKTIYRDTHFTCDKKKISDQSEAQRLCEKTENEPFKITDLSEKKVTEQPPLLYDLTSLQVDCNKRFGLSADKTLQAAQSLYEKKMVSYPRVDTRYLPDDLYSKVPVILKGLNNYNEYTSRLDMSSLSHSKRIFNNVKVTDHHAIIPTGKSGVLTPGMESKIYDLICRTFIAAFYPPAILHKTKVSGETAGIIFIAKGSRVEESGYRILFENDTFKEKGKSEEEPLPLFVIGESGPHKPYVDSKMTKPPAAYTEATLLRAMESAGKQVDDESLRELMKENGLGRPSTRANIIETLFRRNYIRRDKKNIIPTQTGIELIGIIENPLIKSAELTGLWEGKLKQIERGEFTAAEFITGMEEMIVSLIAEVKKQSGTVAIEQKKKKTTKKRSVKKTAGANSTVKKISTSKKQSAIIEGLACPCCKIGKIMRGRQAYGCNRYKEGCTFVVPFEIRGIKITDKQFHDLLTKGKTSKIKGLKGLKGKNENVDVSLSIRNNNLEYHGSKENFSEGITPDMTCPICGIGRLVKGRFAWGCSRYNDGCRYLVPF
ncbi:MAG: DNA topoisomerase 3 [Spirochaetes bacterium]|nr:DNA topoisomerase 3 [Spirochaetota bacterium]MBN2770314.1 DNA topoisomerase 3 [Spirochaetota bacterium]